MQHQPMSKFDPELKNDQSILGDKWTCIYLQENVPFAGENFETAMINVIQQPNINSTVLLRADILFDDANLLNIATNIDPRVFEGQLQLDLSDVVPRAVPCSLLTKRRTIVRRLVPRAPKRDPVANQTCQIAKSEPTDDSEPSMAVIYTAHFKEGDLYPFYLPAVKSIAILYHKKSISIHYYDYDDLQDLRTQRMALHLLETAFKHSKGASTGYKKRVHHDLVVDKVRFQTKYIELKQKYAKDLVSRWAESTDPNKHVFEDLAIASFLIELWGQMYKDKSQVFFADLGCGNGLLVYILIMEGYWGYGVDARRRKSWAIYPPEVQMQLQEKVLVPPILIDDVNRYAVSMDPRIMILDIPETTFVIGNHSDELTLWIPLLNCPFMVIPCCSHALSGARHRFCGPSLSTYAGLVVKAEQLAQKAGWKTEKEALRIPSTRNIAIIGRVKSGQDATPVAEIVKGEGGAEGWIAATMELQAKLPRSH